MFNTDNDEIVFESYPVLDLNDSLFKDYDKALILKEKLLNNKTVSFEDFSGLEQYYTDSASLEALTVSNESRGLFAAIIAIIAAIIAAIISFIIGRKNKTSDELEKSYEDAAKSASEVINIQHSHPISNALPLIPVTDITEDSSPQEVAKAMAANPEKMEMIAERNRIYKKVIGDDNAFLILLVHREGYFDKFYLLSYFINLNLIKRFKVELEKLESFYKNINNNTILNEKSLKDVESFNVELEKEFESKFNKALKNDYSDIVNKCKSEHDNAINNSLALLNCFINYLNEAKRDKVGSQAGLPWHGMNNRLKNKKVGLFSIIKDNKEFKDFLNDKKPIEKTLNEIRLRLDRLEIESDKAIPLFKERDGDDLKDGTSVYVTGRTKNLINNFRQSLEIYSNFYKFATHVIETEDKIVLNLHKFNNLVMSFYNKHIKRPSTESFKNLPLSSKW
jgi:hypothetical protein